MKAKQNSIKWRNLAIVIMGGMLSLGYFSLQGTTTRNAPRQDMVEFTVSDGAAVWISATAQTRVGTVDMYVKNNSGDATVLLWKLRDPDDDLATIDSDGATLVATTGWILVKDVPWNFGIESDGAILGVMAIEGGKR